MSPEPSLDLNLCRDRFEESQDFTIGLEEEFAIVDPGTLELAHRFTEMMAACRQDEILGESAAGELIDTEIEIRSGRAEDFADAIERQTLRRARLFDLAGDMGLALGSTGAHPWADYLDQQIIETPHYIRLREELGWVARRNNTWSMHVHVGVRGADRAVAVCDHLREHLPALLALSANSPFLDGEDTGLHSIRTQIFTRSFPRCGVHEPFGDWPVYAKFIEALERTGSIAESTQLWWSVRPHHHFGTVELRICDAQASGRDSFALAALVSGCIAQSALDYDDGVLPEPLAQRQIEENLWRAIRFGLDGEMIDWRGRGDLVPARQVVDGLMAWTAPARAMIDGELELPVVNGAQRDRALFAEGVPIADIYRASLDETQRTYAPTVTAPAD